jgi:Flp pilus assembly protein TadB
MMSRRERRVLRLIERDVHATDPQLATLMSGQQPSGGQPLLVIALIVLATGLVVLSLVFTAVVLVLAAAVVTMLAATVQFRWVRPTLRTSRM